MMDIDLVYLWVNGNDPKWIAKRNACIGKPSGKQENCDARYADNGELKYSLRSIEKYAPWVRKIFIVTDDQVPEWLDTSNPKIRIIDHTEIMPAESLPCFNSTLLEHFLCKIPDLSEYFLYANDDTYLNRPVTPKTFFAEDNLPYIYMRRKYFRKQTLAFLSLFRKKVLKKPLNLYVQIVNNAALFVEKKYGKYYGCKPHHNIDAYKKSTILMTNKLLKDEISAMCSNHMRSYDEIHRSVYSYVALAEHQGHLKYVTQKHSFQLPISKRKQYNEFEKYNPIFFCMNDDEHSTEDDRRFSIEYLNNLFPIKSSFEK